MSRENSQYLSTDNDAFWELIDSMQDQTERTSRSGHTYKTSSVSGDGYWCPTHDGGCYRRCDDRRWGKYGAAGVLFFHRATGTFLLNQRSKAIHHGGTWSTIGGALDKGETALDGALREAEEEIGRIKVDHWQIVSHEVSFAGKSSEWTYTTLVVEVEDQFEADNSDWETADNAWVTLSEMARLPLHPGFKSAVHDLVREMYMTGAFGG